MLPSLPSEPTFDSNLDLLGPGGAAAITELIRTVGIVKDMCVLEVGCGSGRTACQLAQETGCTVVATDIDPNRLEQTLARVAKSALKGRVIVRQADLRTLFAYFPTTRFDVVLAENTVREVGIGVAATNAINVLQAEGYFIFTLPTWARDPEEAPEYVRSYWEDHAPMAQLQYNLNLLGQHGFPRGFAYPLPSSAWDACYEPIRELLAQLPANSATASPWAEEIDVFDNRRGRDWVQAVVYVGQRPPAEIQSLVAAEAESQQPPPAS